MVGVRSPSTRTCVHVFSNPVIGPAVINNNNANTGISALTIPDLGGLGAGKWADMRVQPIGMRRLV